MPSNHLLLFTLDARRFALPVARVQRVVRVVEITPLPAAPQIVLGVVNLHGSVIPVLDPRQRFGLPARDISLDDRLLVADTARRRVALLVDEATDVTRVTDSEILAAGQLLPAMKYVEGVVKLEDGLLFIHDLDTFLSLDEERTLDDAMP